MDNVLSSLLHNSPDLVYKYHEHDSLLENKPEQDLSEADKAEAWAAYEKDLTMTRTGMPEIANMGDFPNMNPNYRGMSAAGLYSPYANFGRGYGNFGLFNSPPYGGNMNPASLLPGYLGSSYQQTLASITNELPNYLRMRQMGASGSGTGYSNPYGSMSPPSGQTSPFSSGSGYGVPSGMNQNYYNPITPPNPIRPMSGGFASLSDMANFLAVPTSTPPPPAHISSISPSASTSGSNSGNPDNLGFNHTALWKSFFNREMPNMGNLGYPNPNSNPNPSPSPKISQSSSNLMHSSPSVTMPQSNSSMSISKSNTSTSSTFSNQQLLDRQSASNISNTTNSLMSLAKELGAKSLPSVTTAAQLQAQPSIPTSVITPAFKPIQIPPATKGPTPKPPQTTKPPTPKPSSPVVVQTPLPRKSPVVTTNSRYSPTAHVIIRNANSAATTTTVSAVPVPVTQTTTVASSKTSPLVKNFNMGIVYPSPKDKNQSETLASYLQSSKSMVTIVNNSSPSSMSANAKKIVTTKPSNAIPPGSTIMRKGNSYVTVNPVSNQNKSAIASTTGQTRIVQTPINQSTGTKLNSATIQQINKTKSPFEININELSKTSGLSITPIPSKSSAQSSSSSSTPSQQPPIQRITIKSTQGSKTPTTTIIKPSTTTTSIKPTTATIKQSTTLTKQPIHLNKTVPPIRLTHVRTNPTISTQPQTVRSNATITTVSSPTNGTVRRIITTAPSSSATSSSATAMNPPQLTAVPTASLMQNKRSSSTTSIDRVAGVQSAQSNITKMPAGIRIIPTRQLSQPSMTTSNASVAAAMAKGASSVTSVQSQQQSSNNQKSMPPLVFASPKSSKVQGQMPNTPSGITTRR